MADAADSHNIARRTFEVSRRGYEQQEVRGYLHEVSALVERLQREVAELRERAERAETRLGLADAPDEAMLLEVLGEETTRVLTSARDAAAEIRTKAETAAERIVADAALEASEARADAMRDAERRLADAAVEHDALLAEARGELERRRAEAEDAAALIRAEASERAQALRDEGKRDLERAREQAEEELERARAQGKDMVAEAQAVRERLLRDLATRRKKARQQVEKLNAGRERLLQAYAVVRRTIDEATDELSTSLSDARLAADAAARRIEDEPEPTLEQLDEEIRTAGLVDLPIVELDDDPEPDDDTPGPLSGEVPAIGDEPAPTAPPEVVSPPTGARSLPPVDLSERRGRRRRKRDGFEGLPAGELTKVEPPAEGEGIRILPETAVVADEGTANGEPTPLVPPDADADAAADVGPRDGADAEGDGEIDGQVVPEVDSSVDLAAADTAVEDEPEAEPEPEREPEATSDDAIAVPGADEPPSPAVEALFARLRAEGADADDVIDEAAEEPDAGVEPEAVAVAGAEPDVEPEEEPAVEPTPFTERDALLDPIDKELGRRLKRALADEQNEVLDLLRRVKPKGVDDLLPDPDDHAARWTEVVADALNDAATGGATWVGGTVGPIADLADELARSLTAPLRDRIDRSFAASDGNLDDVADRVRALYREWKGQRLIDTSRHYAAAAYARGVFDGTERGTAVQWVVDPLGGRCPDCDDNVLGGELEKGTEFPTGHTCAPAHPGCRCLVLAANL